LLPIAGISWDDHPTTCPKQPDISTPSARTWTTVGQVSGDSALHERYAEHIACLVVCALRIANRFPVGVIDLQTAVQHRIEDKNGVILPPVEAPAV
jgi:hypothetical protein